ncbi:MAG: IclR family transcriptional regulator [Candidatus Brocadiia bacterium]
MIKVLKRAVAVLEAVGRQTGPTFTDLQRATGLKKATLSRILSSLEELGFVERSPDRTYSVGPRLVALARPALRREVLSQVAERHARRLAGELGELVTVGTVRHGHRYNLARATVERSILVDARLHQRPSPYDTATGRMMLAHLRDEDLEEVVRANGLPGEAWPGGSTREELTEALEQIRRVGHAVYTAPDGEAEALAVPIHGPHGGVEAAVGVSMPSYRLDEERRREVLDALRRTARAMEHELSFELGEPAERDEE